MSRKTGVFRFSLILMGFSAAITASGCSFRQAVSDGVFSGVAGVVTELLLAAAESANVIDRGG